MTDAEMNREDSWEQLAGIGESEWRGGRYRQAISANSRACDVVLAELGLPSLSKIAQEPPSRMIERFLDLRFEPEIGRPNRPLTEIDARRFAGFASALVVLASCHDRLGESDESDTAFELSVAVIFYLIEQTFSEIRGDNGTFSELLCQCGRTDLAEAVLNRMSDKALEILG